MYVFRPDDARTVRLCCVEECLCDEEYGSHVEVDVRPGRIIIFPFCDFHNLKYRSEVFWMPIKAQIDDDLIMNHYSL